MGMSEGISVFLSGGEPFIAPKLANSETDAFKVSNYVTSKFLGRGGFGRVYLGSHTITGKQVALKCMPMQVRSCAAAGNA